MHAKINVGLVGATGLVGALMRDILLDRAFPLASLRVFASSRSAGSKISFGDQLIEVEEANAADYSNLDIVLMSAGGEISKMLAPRIAAQGATVIDNSSAWRKDLDVPLVVSEVNGHVLQNIPKGIIANPNCTTMIAMPALKPLHEQFGLRRVVASTYQAVSGSGVRAVRELELQESALAGRADDLTYGRVDDLPEAAVYTSVIAHNIISIAGNFVDNETDEEHKFRNESRRILEIPDLDVTCTCVRVPVYAGHSLSLDLEFTQSVTPDAIQQILRGADGVQLFDVPTPLEAVGGDVSLVGRIRRSGERDNRIAMFISGDNLRKGAALNAVQIAELVVAQRA